MCRMREKQRLHTHPSTGESCEGGGVGSTSKMISAKLSVTVSPPEAFQGDGGWSRSRVRQRGDGVLPASVFAWVL